jgi:hypothetical protein
MPPEHGSKFASEMTALNSFYEFQQPQSNQLIFIHTSKIATMQVHIPFGRRSLT